MNDLSARGDFVNGEAVAPVFAYDWLAHKGQDGFCPCGPGIVPEWLLPQPDRLRMRLSVNGSLMQDSTTAGLITGIPELISAASRWVTLEAGDLILSGTPAGVGAARDHWLDGGRCGRRRDRRRRSAGEPDRPTRRSASGSGPASR